MSIRSIVGRIRRGSVRSFHRITDRFARYSEEECRGAFVEYMNAKARDIGALTASFSDASGYRHRSSKASANDLLHILVCAAGKRQIVEIWNKREHRMHILGINERTVVIQNTFDSSFCEKDGSVFLGGKTGTVPDYSYNLMWCEQRPDRSRIACVVLGAPDDAGRWTDAERIQQFISTGDRSALTGTGCRSFVVCRIPSAPIQCGGEALDILAEKNADEEGTPASLAKVLSLICATDYIVDLRHKVRIRKSDIVRGSGNNLRNEDVVTIEDLFYDMLLPSSNTAAYALARYVGKLILEGKRAQE